MSSCNKVAFYNGKGGCGKTTSIFHTIGEISLMNQKGLVIDLDKQRNSTSALLAENQEEIEHTIFDVMMGVEGVGFETIVKKAYFRTRGNANPKYYGVDVLPSDVRLENESLLTDVDIKDSLTAFIEEQQYDWVLVDMPPSNKAINRICFSQIADYIIVPFTSDVFSINGYGDLIDVVNGAREYNEKLKILGIYLSRYDRKCAVDKYIRSELSQFGDLYIDIQIPQLANIRESVMYSRPIGYFQPDSTSRKAYKRLVDYMISKISNY